MLKKTPYEIIISRHVTEKARVLQELKANTSNPSVTKCDLAKYVFLVHKKANKVEIAKAIEEIYLDKKIKVKSVNTITNKPKKRRVRGRVGFKAGFKKAIVTLDKGCELEEQV